MCDHSAQFIEGVLQGYDGVVDGLIGLEEVIALLFKGFGACFLLCHEGLNTHAVNVDHFGVN